MDEPKPENLSRTTVSARRRLDGRLSDGDRRYSWRNWNSVQRRAMLLIVVIGLAAAGLTVWALTRVN